MKPTLQLFLLLSLCTHLLSAQKLPVTNVYLFDIKIKADSTFDISSPTYLTAFNSEGYNNQPFFMNKEEIYLTVQMAEDTSQTDIYSLNFMTGVKTQITDTPESEYSPLLKYSNYTDIATGAEFSCIRVGIDDNATQQLWRFPINRSNNGEVIFKDMEDIGYHAWVADDVAALFIVGSPHRLVISDDKNGKNQNIGSNIGRCLQRDWNGRIFYVRKLSPDAWYLRNINPITRKTSSVTETIPGVEDFAVMEDGSILMAKGSKLFRWSKKGTTEWKEIADFENYGISNISRLAVRKGKLALVNKKAIA